jgi:hypothetical protein
MPQPCSSSDMAAATMQYDFGAIGAAGVEGVTGVRAPPCGVGKLSSIAFQQQERGIHAVGAGRSGGGPGTWRRLLTILLSISRLVPWMRLTM